MAVRLYNTLSQTKVDLPPPGDHELGMYVCGLTVQDVAHIGHGRALVAFDVVARTLRARGYRVKFVRNITDVDDKIIARAKDRGVTTEALTAETIAAFRRDMEALGCLAPDVEPKVTEHIEAIVALVQELVDRGHAYAREGDVYFRVRSFPAYGKLSRRRLEDLRAGARVEVGEKKDDPLDFALWKASKPGEPKWKSPWGQGRPGWHIECSAMALEYLGAPFDIHGGGMDLVFPHHENEIAQSEAARGVEFARIWMHNGFVNFNKEKMSKSIGNVVNLREILAWMDPEAVRYFLLATHYRGPIQLEIEPGADGATRFPGLEEAERRVAYCYETLGKIDAVLAELGAGKAASKAVPGPGSVLEIPDHRATFDAALDDDLNTSAALAALGETLRLANDLCDRRDPNRDRLRATLERLRADVAGTGACLGILQATPAAFLERAQGRALARTGLAPSSIEDLIRKRAEARARKDFARADAIRDELLRSGIEIRDAAGGTTWRVLG